MKWHNKFDNRLMLLCSIIFLFFFVVNSSLEFFEYKSEQKQWRDSHAEKNKRFFINLLNNEYTVLSEFVSNYASDDQLYRIVNNYQTLNKFALSDKEWPMTTVLLKNQSEKGIALRLDTSLLSNHQFNTVLVQDNDGQVIHAVSDLKNAVRVRLSSLMNKVNNDNEKGLVIVDKRIFYYVKMPIVDSNKSYTPNGYLTVFCLLNGWKIDNLSQNMDKSLFLIEGEKIENNVRFKLDGHLVARESKREQLTYFDSFTYDLFADTKLLLPFQVNLKLPVNNIQIDALYARLLIQLFVFILSTFGTLYLIKRFVTKPLRYLISEMHIAETTLILPEKNHNDFLFKSELGGLYSTFESLFLRLDEKHKLNEALLNAIGDIIITVDEQGLITYVNPPAEKWLYFSQKELLMQPLSLFLVNLKQTEMSTTHWLYNALNKQQDFHQACLLRRLADDKLVDKMEVIVRPLVGLDHVSGAMVILRHSDPVLSLAS
jgi:PAS domain-containing protein